MAVLGGSPSNLLSQGGCVGPPQVSPGLAASRCTQSPVPGAPGVPWICTLFTPQLAVKAWDHYRNGLLSP